MDLFTIIIIISFVDIMDARTSCVLDCTCHNIRIRGTLLKTLSCPKKNLSNFPTGIDNTTQFMRLEGNNITDIPYNLSKIVPDLQRIDMSYNKVTRLRSRIFAGLRNLNAVNLVSNKITTIEDRIFEGSDSKSMNLKLRGNNIKEIDEDAFRGLYANSEIDIRNNSLKKLHPNTLNGVRIMTLDLTHNQLDSLPDDLFQNQDQLYYLQLGSNNISSLNERVFRGLPILETLDLSSNKLKEIPDNLFQHSKAKVITLNLDSNMFTSPPSLRLPTSAKVSVTLKNNPVICDCNLKRLLSNLSNTVNVKEFDKVICMNSRTSVSRMLNEMDCRTTTPAPTTTTPAPTTNFTIKITSTTVTTMISTNSTNTTKISSTHDPTTIEEYIVSTTTFRSTMTSTTNIGIKYRPGINRLTVLVSSMITVVVFVMIGIFCYINRQRILNIAQRPFKLYDVERRHNQETLCSYANDEFHIAGWDNPTTAAFARSEGSAS